MASKKITAQKTAIEWSKMTELLSTIKNTKFDSKIVKLEFATRLLKISNYVYAEALISYNLTAQSSAN